MCYFRKGTLDGSEPIKVRGSNGNRNTHLLLIDSSIEEFLTAVLFGTSFLLTCHEQELSNHDSNKDDDDESQINYANFVGRRVMKDLDGKYPGSRVKSQRSLVQRRAIVADDEVECFEVK